MARTTRRMTSGTGKQPTASKSPERDNPGWREIFRPATSFYDSLRTTFEEEIRRYDAVIFFEMADVGNLAIEGGNPARKESIAEAVSLDSRLQSIWSRHPHYHFIPHEKSFFKKFQVPLSRLTQILETKGLSQ